MAGTEKSWPIARAAAIALAAVIVAGGFALYVTHGVPGNTSAALADSGKCAAKAGKAKALAAAATGEVAAMGPADPPLDLGKLAFDGPDGVPVKLADFSGRTILLNLWATWCAPCRAEMPALDALQKEEATPTFQVVAVNTDTGGDKKPKKFLADTGATTLTYYSDHSMGLFNELKRRGLALGLPVTLLVDGDGCLLTHMNGPAAWASADAKAFIAAARS